MVELNFIGSMLLGAYVLKQLVLFAGGIDNQYRFNGSRFHTYHPVMVSVLNVMGICIYFMGVFFSSIRCVSKKIMDRNEIFLPALIFIAYTFLERQTRYRYEQYYMLFLMAVPGMASVYQVLKEISKKVVRVI